MPKSHSLEINFQLIHFNNYCIENIKLPSIIFDIILKAIELDVCITLNPIYIERLFLNLNFISLRLLQSKT